MRRQVVKLKQLSRKTWQLRRLQVASAHSRKKELTLLFSVADVRPEAKLFKRRMTCMAATKPVSNPSHHKFVPCRPVGVLPSCPPCLIAQRHTSSEFLSHQLSLLPQPPTAFPRTLAPACSNPSSTPKAAFKPFLALLRQISLPLMIPDVLAHVPMPPPHHPRMMAHIRAHRHRHRHARARAPP